MTYSHPDSHTYPQRQLQQKWLSHPLWSNGPSSGTLIEKRERLEIRESESLRWLHRCNGAVESVMDLTDKNQLILPHSQAMSLARLFNSTPSTVLNLGLGGGDLVRYLLGQLTAVSITSVENDSHLIKLHQQHFSRERNHHCNDQHQIILNDANAFVQSSESHSRYDFIFVDLFDEAGICPFVLSSRFTQACSTLLNPNGILCINFILDSPMQLQNIATQLHRQLGTVPLMLNIPKHPNIIALASASFPLHFSAEKLLARARGLGKENTIDTDYVTHFTRQLIRDNGARFLK
ncbi:MAG: hypothetical protein KUG82_01695 [Pseudomonadales bacterium]|nr:hypothetical protein [Pseudomonadales bacterium]